MAVLLMRLWRLVAGDAGQSIMLAVVVIAVAGGGAAWWWRDVKGEIREAATAQCNTALETARADQAEAREKAMRAAVAERDWTLAQRSVAMATLERELTDAAVEREVLRAQLDKKPGAGDLIGLDADWMRRGGGTAESKPRPAGR